jgi:hypothetical protein
VLQASSSLTTAESNVLNSAANYEKSKVLLDYYTAETLTKLGIDVADAESGKVKHKPMVQGVVPAEVQDVLSPPASKEQSSQPQSTAPETAEPHR